MHLRLLELHTFFYFIQLTTPLHHPRREEYNHVWTTHKKNRLTEAAGALIEAARLETDSMTQKKLTANLNSLKSSFADNLNIVVQKMQLSNENFDAKIPARPQS